MILVEAEDSHLTYKRMCTKGVCGVGVVVGFSSH